MISQKIDFGELLLCPVCALLPLRPGLRKTRGSLEGLAPKRGLQRQGPKLCKMIGEDWREVPGWPGSACPSCPSSLSHFKLHAYYHATTNAALDLDEQRIHLYFDAQLWTFGCACLCLGVRLGAEASVLGLPVYEYRALMLQLFNEPSSPA